MVRHNHHATNPEKLIPKMLATPVRLPMAANWPMVEKENGFMTPPRTDAIRFFASTLRRAARAGWLEDDTDPSFRPERARSHPTPKLRADPAPAASRPPSIGRVLCYME